MLANRRTVFECCIIEDFRHWVVGVGSIIEEGRVVEERGTETERESEWSPTHRVILVQS